MPEIEILMRADLGIQIHVLAASIAIITTPAQLLSRRKGAFHKMTGYIWVVALAVTAISSFFINNIQIVGPFSPIHLISVWTLYALYKGVRSAVAKDISQHQSQMRDLAFGALGIAGAIAVMPGRMMNKLLFPDQPIVGFLTLVVAISAGYLLYRSRKFGQGSDISSKQI